MTPLSRKSSSTSVQRLVLHNVFAFTVLIPNAPNWHALILTSSAMYASPVKKGVLVMGRQGFHASPLSFSSVETVWGGHPLTVDHCYLPLYSAAFSHDRPCDIKFHGFKTLNKKPSMKRHQSSWQGCLPAATAGCVWELKTWSLSKCSREFSIIRDFLYVN